MTGLLRSNISRKYWAKMTINFGCYRSPGRRPFHQLRPVPKHPRAAKSILWPCLILKVSLRKSNPFSETMGCLHTTSLGTPSGIDPSKSQALRINYKMLKCGTIYQITCGHCQQSYVGNKAAPLKLALRSILDLLPLTPLSQNTLEKQDIPSHLRT